MITSRTRRLFAVWLSLCLAGVISACASTPPVLKIGLVAPFEGRFRAVGYEAIYAARLAIREINARGGVNGFRLELVALDDRGEPDRAVAATRQLILDRQVIAVIGHYRPDTTTAASRAYCAAGLPLIAVQRTAPAARCAGAFTLGLGRADQWPDDALTFISSVPDPNTLPAAQDFVAAYTALPIDGTRAGPIALQTYEALYLICDAIERAAQADRGEIAAALAKNQFSGLVGSYAFDDDGGLRDPRAFVYEYDERGQPQLK